MRCSNKYDGIDPVMNGSVRCKTLVLDFTGSCFCLILRMFVKTYTSIFGHVCVSYVRVEIGRLLPVLEFSVVSMNLQLYRSTRWEWLCNTKMQATGVDISMSSSICTARYLASSTPGTAW